MPILWWRKLEFRVTPRLSQGHTGLGLAEPVHSRTSVLLAVAPGFSHQGHLEGGDDVDPELWALACCRAV